MFYNVIDRQVNYTKLQLANEPVFYHIVKLEVGGYVYFMEGFTGPTACSVVATKQEIFERFGIEL